MGEYRDAFWNSQYAGLGMPRRHQRSGRYRTYTPSPLSELSLDVSADAMAEMSEADRLCAALDASLATRQQWGKAPLSMLRFLEAIGSSAMEGYRSAAARLVATMATGGAGAKGSDLTIVANLAAVDRAHALADAPSIDTDDLVDIQACLMNERGESSLVGVRDEQNWVGGSDYHPLGAAHVPPPPGDVPALMEDLCEFVTAASTAPPLLRAGLAHAQFETIHPFLDGNGRTGRAMVHMMLRRDGLTDAVVLPLSGAWGRDKARYIGMLTMVRTDGPLEQGVLDEVARYMADTVTQAVTGAFAIAASVQQTEEALRDCVGVNFRSDSVAHRIAHDACVKLGVTVESVSARHGVDKVAVLRALDRMEDLGLVRRRSVQRPHVFFHPPIVRVVEKFAAQIPEGRQTATGVADPDALIDVAVTHSANDSMTTRAQCGVWMPRSRTHCVLSVGHAGWPTGGHRSGA